MWSVDVIAYDDGAVVKTLGPFATQRAADRADDGLNRNLDHAAYYTVIRRQEQAANG